MKHILYCEWDEFTKEDALEIFPQLGYDTEMIHYEWRNLGKDEEFAEELTKRLQKTENGKAYFSFVFSYNFFPVVSQVCEKMSLPYISLVFDSPFYPLTSTEINNSVNHIYTFDRKQVEEVKKQGITTIHYSPLPVNGPRITKQTSALADLPYEHEVTFLGQLYRGEYDFYDQMHDTLPVGLRGALDGLVAAQSQVFGQDLIGNPDILSDKVIDELHSHVKFELSGRFKLDERVLLRDMIRRKVTKNERWDLMERLGRVANVDLYSFPYDVFPAGVTPKGYADYVKEMPRIFNRSKINLNLTLRTIISGIPLRVTDVLAAGGFLITTYQEEIAAQFVDGDELVLAYTPNDLCEKCSWYLQNDAERERIAANGRKKVQKQFDYLKILSDIIKKSL